jgi:hypothetical protein
MATAKGLVPCSDWTLSCNLGVLTFGRDLDRQG